MSAPAEVRVSEDGHLQTELPSNDAQKTEVIKAVDELLDLITVKFSKISTEVFAKMDEMAQRLDELEASIKAGVDATEGS
ncbi:hypothetical protein MMC07_008854 [Pseudocyphellaria aurata]|nr:hypothetical protein [Pseudocyphellaria aurata]